MAHGPVIGPPWYYRLCEEYVGGQIDNESISQQNKMSVSVCVRSIPSKRREGIGEHCVMERTKDGVRGIERVAGTWEDKNIRRLFCPNHPGKVRRRG